MADVVGRGMNTEVARLPFLRTPWRPKTYTVLFFLSHKKRDNKKRVRKNRVNKKSVKKESVKK